ncbi:tyrosine-type recombinase/integrase [Desulfobacterota bacterium AH_259_B03_O07]|nr:tyrosine-type recombinase/integrase [Desulfobacterota bacterium AH_259_B03_O07]
MGVYKKDNRWYIDYYQPDGKRKRETVTIPGVDPIHINRQDALKALSIRKAQIAEGKFEIAQTKEPVLLDKFAERYIEEYSKPNKRSWKRDITSIKTLLKFFSGKNLNQINSWQIEKYKAIRQKDISRNKKLIAKATINKELSCLKTMFNKAIDWGFITVNPVKRVKLFPERPNKLRILSNNEFQTLYKTSSDFLKPILVIALNSGMRRSEILNLKHDDIDLNQEYLTVRDSKNNESRSIPLNKTLKETIRPLLKNNNNEYLFGDQIIKQIRRVESEFYKALRLSGINKCTFHDLRHTFASRLVMAGYDLVTVGELLGHKDIKMTKRYSHPTPLHKMKAVESLNFETLDTSMDTRDEIKQAG